MAHLQNKNYSYFVVWRCIVISAKITDNLTPFPRLYLFMNGFAPLIACGSRQHRARIAPKTTSQTLAAMSMMRAVDPCMDAT